MNWEELEALYWRFDAMHKGYGEWEGTSTSERDAFKRTIKQALAEKDAQLIQQQDEYAAKWEAQEERISSLIETNNKLRCAYQQLMEQAIWAMGKYYDCLRDWNDADSQKDRARVEAFLKEREGRDVLRRM